METDGDRGRVRGGILFYAVIFARRRSALFFKRFVLKTASFSSKPDQICHCEEGIFNARRGNL